MNGSVLIAGSGWRVSRFIVPALLNEGVASERIVILRRSAAGGTGLLSDIRVVTHLDELSTLTCNLTVNCVSAASLVPMQRLLLRRFPYARHVCDTPIFNRSQELRQVLAMTTARLYSLEDWPLMPNLEYVIALARHAARPGSVSIEHFGVPGHFLALFRALCRRWWPAGRTLTGTGTSITGTPRPGLTVSWTGPKQFARAKVAVRTADTVIEDFHETEPKSHNDAEVLYRVIDDGTVRYFCGPEQFSASPVQARILSTFEPFGERKNVHELDKFIGVTRVVRHLLGRTGTRPYSYLSSARDAVAARRLAQGIATRLW